MSAPLRISDHVAIEGVVFDPVMANVSEVIEKLVRRRAELRAEIERVEAAIETLRSLSGIEESKVASVKVEPPQVATSDTQRERGILPPDDVARFARNVLLKVGRPLKRGALVRAMEVEGVPLAGKDKAKNLGTILWRHNEDFVSLEKFGYWPRDVFLDGAYDPQNPPDGIYSPRLKNEP